MKEEIEMENRKRNESMNGVGGDILVALLLVDVPWAIAKQASIYI